MPRVKPKVNPHSRELSWHARQYLRQQQRKQAAAKKMPARRGYAVTHGRRRARMGSGD